MNFQNDEVSSKELLSQFKTKADVSKLLKQLRALVLENIRHTFMEKQLG